LGALGSLALAGGGAIVKKLIEDNWETVGPVIYGVWDWMVGVYEWVVHPVAIALWVAVLVPVVLVAVIVALLMFANKLSSDLDGATARPKLPPLNESQQKVMAAIVQHGDSGDGLSLRAIPMATGQSQLICDGAIDVLRGWNLIHVGYGMWNTPVTLTQAGRQYILAPDSPLSWLAV